MNLPSTKFRFNAKPCSNLDLGLDVVDEATSPVPPLPFDFDFYLDFDCKFNFPFSAAFNAAAGFVASSTTLRFALIFVAACLGSALTETARAQSVPGFSLNQSAESRLNSVGPSTVNASSTEQLPQALQNYASRLQPLSPVALSQFPIAAESAYYPAATRATGPQPTDHSATQEASYDQAFYDQATDQSSVQSFNDLLTEQAEQMLTREGTGSSVKIAILLAALSLAPALILMTTCYVRVVVVLTLLRQAFGAQQLPSTQILTALSLFVTFLVMAPTWNEIKTQAIDPYTQTNSQMTFDEAFQQAVVPVKQFMARQIRLAKNEESVGMFYRYLPKQSGSQQTPRPTSIEDVPLNVLMPAFLVSELKVAFLLGFQVYLPFLIVDLVVSSVTVSMGMVMLPPTMVSFPLKLILFVMVDGWTLVVGMLMQSFGPL